MEYTLQDIKAQIIFGFVTHVCIRWRSSHRPSSISCPNGQAGSFHSLVLRCRACTGTSEDSSHPAHKNRQFLLFSPAVPCLHRHIGDLFVSFAQIDSFSQFSPALPCQHRHIRGLFSSYTFTYSFHSYCKSCGAVLAQAHQGTLFILYINRQFSQFS